MRGKRVQQDFRKRRDGITPAHAGKTIFHCLFSFTAWDHPRACGENDTAYPSPCVGKGSPPRMRGKHNVSSDFPLLPGITPAHAGKTPEDSLQCRAQGDHPRACGENIARRMSEMHSVGSPPRMRGKREGGNREKPMVGITPAHAGKTFLQPARISDIGDHPRACGENVTRIMCSLPLLGSPPRMRGKLVQWPDDIRDAGITPAHAGKTETGGAVCMRSRDHPRACGENRPQRAQLHARAGSPPRMRGKRKSTLATRFAVRITPAHAGKTPCRRCPASSCWDHPRACGENMSPALISALVSGSPPRMRGKPHSVEALRPFCGITPAHAGKTAGQGNRGRRIWDHPRACGENASASMSFTLVLGSPPRMRGKHWQFVERVVAAGITPAHAGKTCSVTPLRCGERDHPRACGENRASGAESGMRTGSPPRMRGKRLVLPRWRRRYGITPAHAGKTQTHINANVFSGDHPRACGENETS